MALIYGSFSGISTSYARPHINYSITQDIKANTSTISYYLYYERFGGYTAYNYSNNEYTSNIAGDTSVWSTDADFDLTGGNYLAQMCFRTKTITHDSDGTKSIYIGAYGNTNVPWGTYNFGQTVILPTIPREAYITNTIDYTNESSIPLTITNSGNYFVRLELWVGATKIKTVDAGQVTSYTLVPTDAEENTIYALVPNAQSTAYTMRVKTYSDSAYTTQIGSDKDKTGTITFSASLCKPTFTDFALKNTDQSIVNKDKYNNTLSINNSNTLTGSNLKIISGYNNPTATITVANKAVANKSATMSFYDFMDLSGKGNTGAYSESEVEIKINQ